MDNPFTNNNIAEPILPKCGKHGCVAPATEQLYKCPGKDCIRHLHHTCFLKTQGNKPWTEDIASSVVCTKKCYDSIQASISKKKPTWNTDGVNGADDPQSSE